MSSLILACALAMTGSASIVVTPPGRCCGDPGLPACAPFSCPPIDSRPRYERTKRVEAFPVEIGGRPYEVRFSFAEVAVWDEIEHDSNGCPYYTVSHTSGVTALEIVDRFDRLQHRVELPSEVGAAIRAVVLDGANDRGLLLVEPVGLDLDVALKLTLIVDRGGFLAPARPAITLRGWIPGLRPDANDHRPEHVRLGAGDALDVVLETLFDATCTFTIDWQHGIQVPREMDCAAPVTGVAVERPLDSDEDGGGNDAGIVLFEGPHADAASTILEVVPGTPVQGFRARGSMRVGSGEVHELDDDALWLLIDVAGRRGWIHRPKDFGLLGLMEDRC